MKKIGWYSLIIISSIAIATGGGDGNHEHHEEGVHEHKDAAKMQNPVAPDSNSIVRGQALFTKYCAFCHGEKGKGDGVAGKALTPPPSDLTDTTWKHGASDGEIFFLITNGVPQTGMVGFKNSLNDNQRWDLVNFLKSLSSKQEIKSEVHPENEEIQVMYTCPMHPEMTMDKAGKCPKCGMELLQKPKEGK